LSDTVGVAEIRIEDYLDSEGNIALPQESR
jgi:hypothetical protein